MCRKTFDIWEETKSDRLTQMIFCDMSTPKSSEFNIYADVKKKLLNRGILKEK